MEHLQIGQKDDDADHCCHDRRDQYAARCKIFRIAGQWVPLRTDNIDHTLYCGVDRLGPKDERKTDQQQSPIRRRYAQPKPKKTNCKRRCGVNAAMRRAQKHDDAAARMAEGINTPGQPVYHATGRGHSKTCALCSLYRQWVLTAAAGCDIGITLSGKAARPAINILTIQSALSHALERIVRLPV